MLRSYKTTLVLRLRMPISDDLSSRSFVTKIVRYNKVINIPNSMTILHDLLPAAVAMSQAKLTGIYNFCNPGAISHNEVHSNPNPAANRPGVFIWVQFQPLPY